MRWGTFDAAYPPVLTVESGDTVVLECVSGGPEVMPPPGSGLTIPPALAAIHAANLPRAGGHILTGPVAVAGASPGDMLEVRIDKIELGADWGYCGFRPLAGTLPEDFPERYPQPHPGRPGPQHLHAALGHRTGAGAVLRRDGRRAAGRATAPSPPSSRASTAATSTTRNSVEGSTLFLPVWVEGANFSAGDGHGVQGDGEVCINALEICLTGTFTLTLHKGRRPRATRCWRYPRAETPTHFISHGHARGPGPGDEAGAARDDRLHLPRRTNLSREQAYQFCSLAVDFHVTQTVNGEKGVHGMLRKGLLF